jgi:hypothetical protein
VAAVVVRTTLAALTPPRGFSTWNQVREKDTKLAQKLVKLQSFI